MTGCSGGGGAGPREDQDRQQSDQPSCEQATHRGCHSELRGGCLMLLRELQDEAVYGVRADGGHNKDDKRGRGEL